MYSPRPLWTALLSGGAAKPDVAWCWRVGAPPAAVVTGGELRDRTPRPCLGETKADADRARATRYRGLREGLLFWDRGEKRARAASFSPSAGPMCDQWRVAAAAAAAAALALHPAPAAGSGSTGCGTSRQSIRQRRALAPPTALPVRGTVPSHAAPTARRCRAGWGRRCAAADPSRPVGVPQIPADSHIMCRGCAVDVPCMCRASSVHVPWICRGLPCTVCRGSWDLRESAGIPADSHIRTIHGTRYTAMHVTCTVQAAHENK
eukprot:gene23950-biopygen8902